MTEPTTSLQKIQIKNRWSGAVLFECEIPANIESGMAMRHALEKAVVQNADLGVFKTDLFDVLLRAPREIAALRAALVAGKVDGTCYEGECACLVGTIANVRGANYLELGNGIKPNSSRPAEQWFMSIDRGDTPETNQVVAITVEWVDELVGLLNAAMTAS